MKKKIRKSIQRQQMTSYREMKEEAKKAALARKGGW